jgi:mono/diheme cytochrome c family protein
MGRPFTFLVIALLVIAGLAGAFIYSGFYNVGADAPHSRLVFGALEELRERSITMRAQSIAVPADLNSPQRIRAGAGLYAEMCAACHLGPGIEPTEISRGLYPPAPQLARGDDLTAAEQFWTIKHGVKLSAMPAWGKTHSDKLIWDMVALIRQLPKMSPAQYKATVASAPESHEEMMEEGRSEEAHGASHAH